MTTKTVYLFDEFTGECRGACEAHESPLEPGNYLTPAHSTDVAPPALLANQAAVFASGAWAIVPDFRGQTWFDQTTGAPTEIIALGQSAPNLAVTLPAAMQLLQAQKTQIATINGACQSALAFILAPYPAAEVDTWNLQFNEAVAFTANPAAPTPTLSAITASAVATGGAGYTVSALAAKVLTKAAAYTAASGAAIGKRQALTDAINKAMTVAAVQAIVW